MNKRILELAKQAGIKANSEQAMSPQEQLFVQLIVQECLAQVARVDDMLEDDPAQTAAVAWVASTIADHFGVEE